MDAAPSALVGSLRSQHGFAMREHLRLKGIGRHYEQNRNYHKKPVVAKDRFVGVRLDKEVFSKVEDAAMAAGLSISEYIRRTLTHRKITIKEEIVVEVPVIKELIAALGKIGANLNQIAHHFNTGGVLSQQMYRETMKVYADLYAIKFEIEKLGGEFRSHPEAYSRKKQ